MGFGKPILQLDWLKEKGNQWSEQHKKTLNAVKSSSLDVFCVLHNCFPNKCCMNKKRSSLTQQF